MTETSWKNWGGRGEYPSDVGLDDMVEVCFPSRRRAVGTVLQFGRTLPNGLEVGWRIMSDKHDIISYRRVDNGK